MGQIWCRGEALCVEGLVFGGQLFCHCYWKYGTGVVMGFVGVLVGFRDVDVCRVTIGHKLFEMIGGCC